MNQRRVTALFALHDALLRKAKGEQGLDAVIVAAEIVLRLNPPHNEYYHYKEPTNDT